MQSESIAILVFLALPFFIMKSDTSRLTKSIFPNASPCVSHIKPRFLRRPAKRSTKLTENPLHDDGRPHHTSHVLLWRYPPANSQHGSYSQRRDPYTQLLRGQCPFRPVTRLRTYLRVSVQNGFTDNASTFNGDQQTFPKPLQQAGYQTAMIGKWHLISEPQGFDHWSILSGQHEQGDYYDPDFWEDGKHIVEKGYATDIITDKAIKFLEGRDKSKPFCMMYHQKAPHRNWMPAPRHLGIFNNTTFPEPASLFDDYEGRGRAAREQDMSIEHTLTNDWDLKLLTREEMLKDTTNRLYSVYKRMPAAVQDKWDSVYAQRIAEYRKGDLKGKALISWKYQQYMRDYLATVLSVDENIGRVHLKKTVELDNTIIVYNSDQGLAWRTRLVRQALHVRVMPAHIAHHPLPQSHQGGKHKQCNLHECGLRSHLPRL